MTYPFIQAKNCGPNRFGEPIQLIVLHTIESPERDGTARKVAEWMAGKNAPQASVHYCIDSLEIIQCVHESVVAWGAPKANRYGIHLEHAGYASQNLTQWNDLYSEIVLSKSAELAAQIVKRYDIPIVRLMPEELYENPHAMGFCGHHDVTYGRNLGKGHIDPGPSFPWRKYLRLVNQALGNTDPDLPSNLPPPPPLPDDIA